MRIAHECKCREKLAISILALLRRDDARVPNDGCEPFRMASTGRNDAFFSTIKIFRLFFLRNSCIEAQDRTEQYP